MHGVKRFTPEKRAAMRKENEERAVAYRTRSTAAMNRRAAKAYDVASLEAVAKVVTENPDFATLWNFRREILEHTHSGTRAEARKAACAAEFALTQECLGINPKSYPVWYHREWVLQWGSCDWQWPVELKLTAKLLALDDRNFHCWTYRRSVVRIAGVAAEAELVFTTGKIEANFSNYSAWHYRSKLLPAIHAGSRDFAAVLRGELELLRNAFFTAPEDSSAWFYHRWLLAQLSPGAAAAAAHPEFEALVRDEIRMVDELVELEPECKWPLAAAAFLSRTLQQHGMSDEETDASAAAKLGSLQEIDRMRKRYYADARVGAAAGGKADVPATPTGQWYQQPGRFFAPYSPSESGAVTSTAQLPSFIESELTTRVEYETWRKAQEAKRRAPG
eukprot:CAMPEP_0115852512 /NCGR_PEP_ID=MMETSP0287-20121206/13036_1 /TAXON_ID=412157 /ORGANISM="Chrysochromulina rotalis, Strain UIO044" /LENGTH=389 /DNA_ID=CAMNT_0003306579 /DNA_START=36 /DNA_END=1205 /DNA_ORIENTATION=+